MKILVLGGSYFYGRVFTMLASKEHELTLFNRGTYSMAEYGVSQMTGDRHDEESLARLRECGTGFDAVVDFCGYVPGDIQLIMEHLPGKIRQYVFISTVDVYKREIEGFKDEETPYETRLLPGEAGSYIAGKVNLEQELKAVCNQKGIAYTVLRPAILYGPYNYAPREAAYIQLAVQNHLLPEITDATGKFQFTYVKDAAEAICRCLSNEKTYGQAYNLCGDEILDYRMFADGLAQAALDSKLQADGERCTLQRYPCTAKQAEEQGIPLPFPVYKEETELYDNEKSKRELGISYTPFAEGMGKTFRAFQGVFG